MLVDIVGYGGGLFMVCWFILEKAYVGMLEDWDHQHADGRCTSDAEACSFNVKGAMWISWAIG